MRLLFRNLCLSILPLALILCGCASPQQREWGSEVHVTPGWEKFKRATIRALKDPGTWVPAAGAVVVLASGYDDEWTQRALSENWLYDSKQNAAAVSDDYTLMLDRVWIASMLISDSSDEGGWALNKLKGMVAEVVIVNTSIFATNTLKRQIDRREPDPYLRHVEHEAFPSNHSTPPFTQVALIRRNLRYSHLNDFSKYSIITGSYLMGTVAAYGRVEAGLHSFADQFAGIALGNFIGLVMYDTFFEEESRWNIAVQPLSEENGAMALFHYSF